MSHTSQSSTSGSRAVAQAIEQAGVVAVIRKTDPARLRELVAVLVEGGVRALEVTMTVPSAIDHIRCISATLPPGFLLGAGTVMDADTARRVIDAGAAFVVSPVLRRPVIEVALAADVLVMPAGLTPTEILDGWDAGGKIIKVFPASVVGTGFLRDLHAPMPHLKLMPTGGVTVDNAADWIRAGAVAVGIGGSLLDPDAGGSGDLAGVVTNVRRLVANVAAARPMPA